MILDLSGRVDYYTGIDGLSLYGIGGNFSPTPVPVPTGGAAMLIILSGGGDD